MIKQVIVIRGDLVDEYDNKLTKTNRGKVIAQAAHASLGAILSCKVDNPRGCGKRTLCDNDIVIDATPAMKEWIDGIFTKICLKCDSEEQLLELYKKAEDTMPKGTPMKLICDNGLTIFDGPTNTCIAIGPAESKLIDEITGDLKLYR